MDVLLTLAIGKPFEWKLPKKFNMLSRVKLTTTQQQHIERFKIEYRQKRENKKKVYTHAIICFKFTENTYKCCILRGLYLFFLFLPLRSTRNVYLHSSVSAQKMQL